MLHLLFCPWWIWNRVSLKWFIRRRAFFLCLLGHWVFVRQCKQVFVRRKIQSIISLLRTRSQKSLIMIMALNSVHCWSFPLIPIWWITVLLILWYFDLGVNLEYTDRIIFAPGRPMCHLQFWQCFRMLLSDGNSGSWRQEETDWQKGRPTIRYCVVSSTQR